MTKPEAVAATLALAKRLYPQYDWVGTDQDVYRQDSSGKHFAPDWVHDWAACGILMVQYQVRPVILDKYCMAKTDASPEFIVEQYEPHDNPHTAECNKHDAVRLAIVKAVLADIEVKAGLA